MTPVLKWAGGKTQLLDAIVRKIPESYHCYYEPFVGSGAVFLALKPSRAVINDSNRQLINLYSQLKTSPDVIKTAIYELDKAGCDRNFYYSVREKYNAKITAGELDAECAALMVWLNKHCFNGLYRVNRSELFNVPYNNRIGGRSIDEDNVDAIASYLQGADIDMRCLDFEEACADVGRDDFVYFDSPYIPAGETANFTTYTSGGFPMEDHKRLAQLFKKLDGRGARLMLSNNDVPLVQELYSGYNFQHLEVRRAINSDAGNRKGKEVIVTNY